MRVIVPPIKSQGIKTKLVPWIKALRPPVKGRWIEPFLGTGVVAFNSGMRQALLGDINPHLIRFYQGIQSGEITPGRVRAYLESEGKILGSAPDNGYEHFRTVRARFNRDHDPLDFLFLSRTGFNGMIRFNRKGEWNIPFCKKPDRFAQAYVTKIVNQVKDVQSIIQPDWIFSTESFEKLIQQATADDFIYCDPPYLGRYVDYYNGWTEDDEQRLFVFLSATPAKFILSTWHHNDFRPNLMIEKYWSKFNIVTRDHFYHVGGSEEHRNPMVEALVFNFPANIRAHNYGIEPKPEQLMLLEEPAEYRTKKNLRKGKVKE